MINKDHISLALFLLVLAVLGLFLWQCQETRNAREEASRSQYNIRALEDTVKVVVNRAGEKQSERLTLIATAEELSKYNQSLYEELKKQRGQVMQLISTTSSIKTKVEGIETELQEDPDSTTPPGSRSYRLAWSYDTTYSPGNFQKIRGFSRLRVLNDSTIIPGTTDIPEIQTGFRLVTGLEKSGEDYKIFVKSDHPGFMVSNIEGAVIPRKNNPLFPERKRWGLGLTLGPTISVGGNMLMPTPFFGIGLSFGLQYNIKEF